MPPTTTPIARPSLAPRLLVLGATGYVGRHICATALDAGYSVHGVARSPRPAVLTSLTARGLRYSAIDPVADDVAFAELLAQVRPDVVVNAAGTLWTPDAAQLRRGNVTTAAAVVTAVATAPCRPRLVHLGTMYEYGPQPDGYCADSGTDGVPQTDYGRTKLIGSRRVLDATATSAIDGVVLRLSSIVGPGIAASSALGTIARTLHDARLSPGGAPVALTAARTSRDYLDVRDAADAVLRAGTADVIGKALPVGSGTLVELRDVMATLVEISGVSAEISSPPPTADAQSDWQYPPADLRLTAPALGWLPRRTLHQTLTALWSDVCPEARAPASLDHPFSAGRHAHPDAEPQVRRAA